MMAKPTRAVELHYAMSQFLIIKIIVLIIIILFYFSVFVICILKMVTIVI